MDIDDAMSNAYDIDMTSDSGESGLADDEAVEGIRSEIEGAAGPEELQADEQKRLSRTHTLIEEVGRAERYSPSPSVDLQALLEDHTSIIRGLQINDPADTRDLIGRWPYSP